MLTHMDEKIEKNVETRKQWIKPKSWMNVTHTFNSERMVSFAIAMLITPVNLTNLLAFLQFTIALIGV